MLLRRLVVHARATSADLAGVVRDATGGVLDIVTKSGASNLVTIDDRAVIRAAMSRAPLSVVGRISTSRSR